MWGIIVLGMKGMLRLCLEKRLERFGIAIIIEDNEI
jgi:hypothetical protein